MRMIHLLIILLIVVSYSGVQVYASEKMDNPKDIVKPFLPVNSELVEAEEPPEAKAVQQYDFDKDGQAEWIVTFKVNGEPIQLKAMVLKKEGEQWKKVWEVTGEGYEISYTGLADMDGDGVKEFLIGWKIGESAGSELEVFQWRENTLDKLNDSIPYHKLVMLTQGKQTYLAVWSRFCCDAYTVGVLKWDGAEFIQDGKMYVVYYPKIKAFYKDKLEAMDAWYYWYALADAQIKANFPQQARFSIQQGLSLDPDNELLMELKKELNDRKKQ